MTDAELLEAYATRRSDSAFSELVSRYVNLVYAVALRQVRDPHLAEDVAQAVFLVLARKAGSIGSNVIMGGWLFRTTRFVATRALRAEARRRHHEVEAAIMNQQISSSEPDEAAWREIAPHLDEAIATLPQKDRDAVLLRFFETQPMRVVGQRLALTEDAAKKRVSRALEKLKQVLLRRGIALGGAAIAAGLGRNGAQAAPAELANRILVAHAGGIGAATTSALVTAALRHLLWLRARVPLAFGGAVVAAMLLLRGLMGPSAATSAPAAGREAVRNDDVPTQTPANAGARNNLTTNAPTIAAPNVFRLHIRDAVDNAPIAGARVIQGSRQTFQADTNGICELPMPTQESEAFRVWVSTEAYVPKMIEWKSYELKGSGVTYTTKLQRGLVLQGVVEDEQGQPISGASISFLGPGISMIERENVGFHPSLSSLKTDESGRFVSHQMPARTGLGLGLTVYAAGFAPQCLPVGIPEGLSTNWVIVLNHGVSLPGRVLTKAGDPISGARVVAEEPHGGVEVAASTDAEGNFKLEHLPLGSASLKAGAAGYDNLTQSVLVESNVAPVIFQLHPAGPPGEPLARQPIRLTGNVVDAESGEPLLQFQVLLNERRGTSRSLLGEGHDGGFDWKNLLTFVSEYALEVNADGYEPMASSIRHRTDGDQTFEFRLNKGGRFAGQVLQPDGQPAVGAIIGLQNDGSSLNFKPPAKLVNYGHPANETIADTRGSFSLNSTVGANALMVVHESGCAALPVIVKTNLTIQLHAWGAIEGTLYVGHEPAGGQMVDVGFQSSSYTPDVPRLPFDLTETTDEQGHFRFDRIPLGTHTVYRYINSHADKPGPIGFSNGESAVVKPGETAYVKLGGKGRTVVGQFVLPPSMTNYDWNARLVSLVQKKEGLAKPREDQFPNTQAFFRAWNTYDASIAKYYLEFQPDGSFRVNDVMPGQYTLALTINAPPKNPLKEDAWMWPGPTLGGITNTVEVPSVSDENAQNTLDLGAMPVPMRQSTGATAQAP